MCKPSGLIPGFPGGLGVVADGVVAQGGGVVHMKPGADEFFSQEPFLNGEKTLTGAFMGLKGSAY